MKVHSGALKPEDQLTQHLPAQTGSRSNLSSSWDHGRSRSQDAPPASPCHAGADRKAKPEKIGGKTHGKAELPTGGLGKMFSLPPRTQEPKEPSCQGMYFSPGAAFACPFPTPLGENSVVLLSLPMISALLTNNWMGIYQYIILYC